MADFDTAIAIVLKNEGLDGSVQPDPSLADPEAVARFGINSGANKMPAGFFEGSMPNDQALALAKQVYRNNYWYVVQGDRIADQVLANHLMDMAVNSGTGAAVMILQCVLFDGGADLVLDGGMGPATLAAANAAGAALARDYRKARAGYYASLKRQAWIKIWLRRLAACG